QAEGCSTCISCPSHELVSRARGVDHRRHISSACPSSLRSERHWHSERKSIALDPSMSTTARKKRKTITGLRNHAMGDSLVDHTDHSMNFTQGNVPENELICPAGKGSDHILVAVRVRPLSTKEVSEGKRSCCDAINSTTVSITKRAATGTYLRSQQGSINEYTFDNVFPPEASQATVYEGTARPFIADLINGINVTVFAYGATGAGKTHTMMGSERVMGSTNEEAGGGPVEVTGIVPQSLVDVFREIERQKEQRDCTAGAGAGGVGGALDEEWTVRVGYLEVGEE
ncbi:unnamed protein product, partial [Discosporangium mesarthrocarpum]